MWCLISIVRVLCGRRACDGRENVDQMPMSNQYQPFRSPLLNDVKTISKWYQFDIKHPTHWNQNDSRLISTWYPRDVKMISKRYQNDIKRSQLSFWHHFDIGLTSVRHHFNIVSTSFALGPRCRVDIIWVDFAVRSIAVGVRRRELQFFLRCGPREAGVVFLAPTGLLWQMFWPKLPVSKWSHYSS